MKKTERLVVQKTIVLELQEWEAHDLDRMMRRIKDNKSVSKSEFSLREKVVGRRIIELLGERNGHQT